jgi:hypothetical protein
MAPGIARGRAASRQEEPKFDLPNVPDFHIDTLKRMSRYFYG